MLSLEQMVSDRIGSSASAECHTLFCGLGLGFTINFTRKIVRGGLGERKKEKKNTGKGAT